MAKEKNATASPFCPRTVSARVYKRSQGRIARQVTFAALAIVVALGRLAVERAADGRGRAACDDCALPAVGCWRSAVDCVIGW